MVSMARTLCWVVVCLTMDQQNWLSSGWRMGMRFKLTVIVPLQYNMILIIITRWARWPSKILVIVKHVRCIFVNQTYYLQFISFRHRCQVDPPRMQETPCELTVVAACRSLVLYDTAYLNLSYWCSIWILVTINADACVWNVAYTL